MPNGLIALLGSGEYLPVMNEIDRYLLSQASESPHVVCLPTAAGMEGEASWGRWNRMGENHFQALGASVQGLPIIDHASANDPKFVPLIERANLIYFSGGDPMYLNRAIQGTLAWEAIQKARQQGAVLAGCSAGAMILAREVPNLQMAGFGSFQSLGVISARMIFPHFDRWQGWRGALVTALRARMKPGEFALGIDEDTALVGGPNGQWQVMGRQGVSLIEKSGAKVYKSGENLQFGSNSYETLS